MSRVQFEISTGTLTTIDSAGTVTDIGSAYSGNGIALDNPLDTSVHGHGPIPVGLYTIGAAMYDDEVGEFALPLTPDPGNQMFGRSGFYWHGDNPYMNHTASDGCIVSSRELRVIGAAYSLLEVIE